MQTLPADLLSRSPDWPVHFLPAQRKDYAYPLLGNRLALSSSASDILKTGISESEMAFSACLTEERADKIGDVVVAAGCRLDNYRHSPVLCVAHQKSPLYPFPVGKAIGPDGNLHIAIEPGVRVAGRFWMAQRGEYAKSAALVFDLICEGILSSVSIGFEPIGRVDKTAQGGHRFYEWDLSEVSLVSVPCLGTATIVREYLSRKEKSLPHLVYKSLEPLAVPLSEWAPGWSVPEVKAMTESSGTAGGYTTPSQPAASAPPPGADSGKPPAATKDVDMEEGGEAAGDHDSIKSHLLKIAGEHAPGDPSHHQFHYHPEHHAVHHTAGAGCDQGHIEAIQHKLMHVDGLRKFEQTAEKGPEGEGWEQVYPPAGKPATDGAPTQKSERDTRANKIPAVPDLEARGRNAGAEGDVPNTKELPPMTDTAHDAPTPRIVKGQDVTLTGPSLALKSQLARRYGQELLTKSLGAISGLQVKEEYLLIDFPSEEKALAFHDEVIAKGGQSEVMRPWPLDVVKGLDELIQKLAARPDALPRVKKVVAKSAPGLVADGYKATQAHVIALAKVGIQKELPAASGDDEEDAPATGEAPPVDAGAVAGETAAAPAPDMTATPAADPAAVPAPTPVPPAGGPGSEVPAEGDSALALSTNQKPSLPFLQGLIEYLESHLPRQEAPGVVEFAKAMLEEARELGHATHPDAGFGGSGGSDDGAWDADGGGTGEENGDGAEAGEDKGGFPPKKGEGDKGKDKKEIKPKADKSGEEEARDDKETDEALEQYKANKVRKLKRGHVVVIKGMHHSHKRICKAACDHLGELSKLNHGDPWTHTHKSANGLHYKSLCKVLKGDDMDDGEDMGGDSMGGEDMSTSDGSSEQMSFDPSMLKEAIQAHLRPLGIMAERVNGHRPA